MDDKDKMILDRAAIDALARTNIQTNTDDSLPFHLQHAITSVDLNVGVGSLTITGTNNKPAEYNNSIYNTQQMLEQELNVLIQKAKRKGYVLTIDLVSNYPPKTGDFVMVPHVRLARGNY